MTVATNALVFDRTIDQLFSSLLFKSKLEDIVLCNKLEKSILNLWKQADGLVIRDNHYISKDNIHELPEFKELCDIILLESQDVLDYFKIVKDEHYISAMWANATTKDNVHHKHVHPNSLISGVFYVRANKGCGPIVFSDPRPGAEMLQPDYYGQRNAINCGKVTVPPETGNLFFFNSWLPHSVERATVENEDLRISISFNIMIKGPVRTYTMRYDF
jgi:hypothetical protein